MIVLEAGGKPIRNGADLKNVLRSAKPGSVVLLRIAVPGGKRLYALNIPK